MEHRDRAASFVYEAPANSNIRPHRGHIPPDTRAPQIPKSCGEEEVYYKWIFALWLVCGVLLAGFFCVASFTGKALSWSLTGPPEKITDHIKVYVDQAIAHGLQDPVRYPDFTLYIHGGRIIGDLTRTINGTRLVPHTSLQAPTLSILDDSCIGECWSISSNRAQLGIKLARNIFPTHITIDHIPKAIVLNIGHTPHLLMVWASVDSPENCHLAENIRQARNITYLSSLNWTSPLQKLHLDFILIATFEYDIHAMSHIQTIPIAPPIIDSKMWFGVIVVEILSNWGVDETCLYCVRVHGHPADVKHV